MEFHERLQLLMAEQKMTQSELARKLKRNRSSVSSWFYGRTQPKSEVVHRLALIFNVSEAWLIGVKDAPFADRTVERVFHDASAAAGVPRIRVHDLRHSHASYLISTGCSIVAVSKRLGHCSVKQTLDTYSHALASDEVEVLSKLAEMDGHRGQNSQNSGKILAEMG